MQNQEMDLALSSDAKPRLKWTPVLHQRFIEAVTQLGGAERATPKSLMKVMGISGLTLYHLKSHLQKYRLGKSQLSESCNDNEQEDNRESEIEGGHMNEIVNDKIHAQSNEGLHVAQALQMQIEVQNKLHEQIEVQRHLQLRIEAQGMYLQSILKKAQETLSAYDSSSTELEAAKTEVSELVSMVETGCLDSTFSEFTKTGCFVLDNEGKRLVRTTDCSLDSSLTSFESYGRKRSGSIISDESSVEQPLTTIPPSRQEKQFKSKKLGSSEEHDHNGRFGMSASMPIRQEIDLNYAEPELVDDS
ncbi:Myb-related protein [Thalictrum thalictroides]|uniref:Myb-related protein n=1 Tax=Thalictrum thalictroides TaxID=46969 RepID=A0A7J6WEK0_THATH|nr:Myb-related protein [Thalictrum thalictroides]